MPINGVRGPGLLPVPGQNQSRPMFRGLAIAASGLSAQRQRIETIAQNIANADVASAVGGSGGYKRRTLMMETATEQNAMFAMPASADGSMSAFGGTSEASAIGDSRQSIEVPLLQGPNAIGPQAGGQQFGVAVTGVSEDNEEGQLTYEPGHPLANEMGYVLKPKIETAMEMANLADAKRLYEANASVFQVTKSMLRAALDI